MNSDILYSTMKRCHAQALYHWSVQRPASDITHRRLFADRIPGAGEGGEPDSDVDLFVVLHRASEAIYEKARQVTYKVMWDADFTYVYLTDMQHYQTLEQHGSSFLRNIQKEGKVLWKAAYKRASDGWAKPVPASLQRRNCWRSRSSPSPFRVPTMPCSMQQGPCCS